MRAFRDIIDAGRVGRISTSDCGVLYRTSPENRDSSGIVYSNIGGGFQWPRPNRAFPCRQIYALECY